MTKQIKKMRRHIVLLLPLCILGMIFGFYISITNQNGMNVYAQEEQPIAEESSLDDTEQGTLQETESNGQENDEPQLLNSSSSNTEDASESQTKPSADASATIYFLSTPSSDPNSNNTKHWCDVDMATGLGDATVNLSGATYDTDQKNIVKYTFNNGNLSQYIKSWPNTGTVSGAEWTFSQSTLRNDALWQSIATKVATDYQAELQKQLHVTTLLTAQDIQSITLIPYKISIKNGNIKTKYGYTKDIHIDCTITVVCTKAYQYGFTVDYPENDSGLTSGTIKESSKLISVDASGKHEPDAITASDVPNDEKKLPPTMIGINRNTYTFDGWYTDADYTNKAVFSYSPTIEEITSSGGIIMFYGRYIPKTVNITVTKLWNDNNDQYQNRPGQITVVLIGKTNDDIVVNKTAIVDAAHNWIYTFKELAAYYNGNKIVYTIDEEAVTGYHSTVRFDESKGYTITNTLRTIDISGKKIWNDFNNQYKKRPDSITIQLYKQVNNVRTVAASKTVQANEFGNWFYTFDGLNEYENGQLVIYTIQESETEGYTVAYDGYDVINTVVTPKPEPTPEPSPEPTPEPSPEPTPQPAPEKKEMEHIEKADVMQTSVKDNKEKAENTSSVQTDVHTNLLLLCALTIASGMGICALIKRV